MRIDRDTKAVGVDDSVRARGMEDTLGRVKANPLMYELGSVPGRKRFDSEHGGATLRTKEACWQMGKVGGFITVRVRTVGLCVIHRCCRT